MSNTMFPLIQKRVTWYIISLILILPGLVSLAVWKLNVGIDFKGGNLLQLQYSQGRPTTEQIRQSVANSGVKDVSVQTAGDEGLLLRFPNVDGTEARTLADSIITQLQAGGGTLDLSKQSFDSIGGSIASDTTKKAVEAVVIASIVLILFIAWSFASVPKPASSWRFGVTAIAALIHDLLFVIGAFSLVGHFFPQIEVDSLFITALLTILGFSVNDTIVVFDRIRENLRRFPTKAFADVANESLNQTIARSINTSGTVLGVLVTLLIYSCLNPRCCGWYVLINFQCGAAFGQLATIC